MSPQKRATIIASVVATILTIVKFAIGVASGSVAVLASAIDSLLDTVISVFNFFAIKKSEEKVTDRFQYGKGKVQAIAAVIEGTIITLSGFYIIYEAIKKAINGTETTMLSPAIMVMIFSIAVTFLLVEYLMGVAKKTNNIVIKSDALHYKTDLISNGVILLSLVLVYLTDWDIIDAIFGFGIGIYIIYSAYEIIEEGIFILMDHALDPEIVREIEKKIDEHPLVTSHHWLKTRTDGSHNFVEFHLVLEPEMTLLEAHRISDVIEERIAKLDDTRRWIITPHYDPYDDEDINDATRDGIPLGEA
ncbi:cation transporter [Sulfurovum sp. bin170]|uniref:cation diffusion facilitator family transporter n=1 Tax=Sulfurovum sp. bin170 TaxID=2695268 RepID=UPI0013DEDF61|nr:cation diffusion facilitator family transporter [Sulfurovum sp. bin170]NEW61312.1 cation transporter [Sulfurovum sp. bin170]